MLLPLLPHHKKRTHARAHASAGATPRLTCLVSGRKRGRSPLSYRACTAARRASSSCTAGEKALDQGGGGAGRGVCVEGRAGGPGRLVGGAPRWRCPPPPQHRPCLRRPAHLDSCATNAMASGVKMARYSGRTGASTCAGRAGGAGAQHVAGLRRGRGCSGGQGGGRREAMSAGAPGHHRLSVAALMLFGMANGACGGRQASTFGEQENRLAHWRQSGLGCADLHYRASRCIFSIQV